MTGRSASPASRSPAVASAGSAGIAAAWPSPHRLLLALGVFGFMTGSVTGSPRFASRRR